MKLTGHKTRSVLYRYNMVGMVSDGDLRAAERLKPRPPPVSSWSSGGGERI